MRKGQNLNAVTLKDDFGRSIDMQLWGGYTDVASDSLVDHNVTALAIEVHKDIWNNENWMKFGVAESIELHRNTCALWYIDR